MKKTVLITGASHGIGRATAIEFAKSGFNIILNFNKSESHAKEVLKTINSIGADGIIIKADVGDLTEVENMYKKAIKNFQKIDVLINNAGISLQKNFQFVTEQEWHHLFDTNIGGMFNCTSIALQNMIPRKYGVIINISSIWGLTGASMEVHYSASKAAVIGFTKALSKELGPSNIRVNCVAPGIINTNMNKNLDKTTKKMLIYDTPLGRLGTPEDISKIIYFLSEHADFITGQVISPNGGIII
ncbi:MAG: 3-oxoacyl-ACP reductase FabG [Candidatus Improbicoccus devescovinae]|nr:MAG: 3-oxoacyl-ACP reductase FabG [Candidatus Improbicoccus devescovinae]